MTVDKVRFHVLEIQRMVEGLQSGAVQAVQGASVPDVITSKVTIATGMDARNLSADQSLIPHGR